MSKLSRILLALMMVLTFAFGGTTLTQAREEGYSDRSSGYTVSRMIEIKGTITNLTSSTIVVAGKIISYNSNTEIEGRLAVGKYVEVEAAVLRNGTIFAREIEVRYSTTPPPTTTPSPTTTPPPAITYTITVSAGTNGSITPSGAVTVNSGANQTFAVTASTGYHTAAMTVDGAAVTPAASYTFGSVTTNHTISAAFAINTYTLTYTAGANGAVSVTSPRTVDYGTNGAAVTAIPNSGYHFVKWSDNSTANPRTDNNVTTNISVAATFAINTYAITASAGANGSISPSGVVTVNSGASQTFTATAAAGYHVATMTVDGAAVAAATSYTFTNVTANHTISATFAINSFAITASAGANGSISPSGTVPLGSGANQTFTITPAAGYHVGTLTVDGAAVAAATSYTFSNVTANHTISATFAINTFTITASAGSNGSISPSGAVTVNSGASRAFTITPATGYNVGTLTVDGAAVTPATSYTFSNVTANHTISATFVAAVALVSYSATIQPMFNNYCSCHVLGSSGGVQLNNYTNAKTASSRLPGMGSGYLPAAQLQLLRDWLSQGALNN